jgi:hypothetical protein
MNGERYLRWSSLGSFFFAKKEAKKKKKKKKKKELLQFDNFNFGERLKSGFCGLNGPIWGYI